MKNGVVALPKKLLPKLCNWQANCLVFLSNYSAVMPECFYRASRFPLAAPLDSR